VSIVASGRITWGAAAPAVGDTAGRVGFAAIGRGTIAVLEVAGAGRHYAGTCDA